jgi:predicted HTH domain antitoxin
MPLTISDEVLRDMNMGEREARIEIACRLYDGGRLSKFGASQLAGLSRAEFEGELTKRGMPWVRLDWDETYADEMRAIAQWKEGPPCPQSSATPRP